MRWLDRLVDIGVAGAPESEHKQIRVVNAIGVISHVLNTPFVALLALGLPESAPVIAVQVYAIVLWTVVMALQYAALRTLARWLAVLGAVVHIGAACALVGDAAPVWPILVIEVLVPFLVFPAHQRAHMITTAILVGVAEVATWHLFASAPPRVPLSPLVVTALQDAVPPTLAAFPALIGVYYHVITTRTERALAAERARSEELLLNVLPESIAARLKAGEQPIADRYDHVTVLFSDIVGFTKLAEGRSPAEVVEILDDLFRAFDEAIAARGLEKIKTIGDAYMVAAGIPTPRADHVEATVAFGLAMARIVAERPAARGLSVRVGVHTGPVVAGVIGHKKFSYDLWGDTVNTASRMESHGVPGAVHVSAAVAAVLGDAWDVEPRGTIDVKGKGPMETFLVRGRRA